MDFFFRIKYVPVILQYFFLHRYAINGATEACFAGHFKHFPVGDLAKHKIHCMTMLYAAESKPGDNLNIFVWEDKLISRRIHIQLEIDSQLVYNTAIDFFEVNQIDNFSKERESKM